MANYSNPNLDFDLAQEKLKMELLRSENLRNTNNPTMRQIGGRAVPFQAGTGAGNVMSRLAGRLRGDMADENQQALGAEQQRRIDAINAQMQPATPVNWSDPNAVAAEAARREALYTQLEQFPKSRELATKLRANAARFPLTMGQGQITNANTMARNAANQKGPTPPSGYQFVSSPNTGKQELTYIKGGPADPEVRKILTQKTPTGETKSVTTSSTSIPEGGTSANTVKPPRKMTATQATSNIYAERIKDAISIFDEMGNDYSPLKLNVLNAIPGSLGNFGLSDKEQRISQAQRNFINATLRRESGAVISQQEFDNAKEQYFPQPGNTSGVLQQKKENRATVLRTMREAAGLSGEMPSDGNSQPVAPVEENVTTEPTVVARGQDPKTGNWLEKLSDGTVRPATVMGE